MSGQSEAPVLEKNPEIVRFQRTLQDQALAHLIETRGHDLWDVYRQELSEYGNLLYKDGKESDERPAHLILDLEVYKELERRTKEALGMSEKPAE